MNAQTSMNIYFDPLIAQHWLIAAAVFGALLFIISFWKNRKGTALRLLTLAVFILTLANPSLLQEQREAISDVAVVVVDQSPSQSFGQRESVSLKALEHLKSTLSSHKDLELRIVSAPDQSILANETLLFSELEKAFSDVVPKRRAGVIFITDGQIHDVPDMPDAYKQFGPIHTLLSGRKNEKDRQLVMLETPSYGIVGQSISLRYKIEDTDNINSSDATMTIKRPGSPPEVFVVPVNQELDMSLPVDHAGQNIFEISVQTIDGEITAANNRAGLIVNGVRDRLKVLLVSGMPHAGGRTWRDLLSSDPGVDLVHFTILREPTKLDATPQNELALIAFPFRELFEVKLYDFDLIIFDRYRLNRILPDHYFSNIVRYVEDGGALLVASGPDFSGEDSLFKTQLKAILPGSPTGEIISKPFRHIDEVATFRHAVVCSINIDGNKFCIVLNWCYHAYPPQVCGFRFIVMYVV